MHRDPSNFARRPDRRNAFTLVELLVVIGIIAILVAIIIPTIGAARRQANAVACQANMRSLMQGLLTYAAESKGSMPYGFRWHRMDADGWPPRPSPVTYPAQHWMSLLESRMTDDGLGGYWPPNINAYTPVKLSNVFRCPAVDRSQFPAPWNYASHMVIMPNASWEVDPINRNTSRTFLSLGATYRPGSLYPIAPATISQLYPDDAVLWDTTAIAQPQAILTYMPGYTITDIDNMHLLYPIDHPENRYRDTRYDSLQAASPFLDPGNPIKFYNSKALERYRSMGLRPNADSLEYLPSWGVQYGSPRFRHGAEDTCNVAFADGSVRGLRVKINRALPYDPEGAPNEFLRRYLLIRPPAVLPPSRPRT